MAAANGQRQRQLCCAVSFASASADQKLEAFSWTSTPQVLEVDSSNAKALYRRAQAWMATADFVEAELDIRAGLAQVRKKKARIRLGVD